MTDTIGSKSSIERPEWLPREVWPFEVRTLQIGDHVVAYTDEGQGKTLLFVHDGMWSYIWGQVMQPLSQRFRVITLDFPGSGLSPASGEEPTLEGDSKLLERFVDRLGLTQFSLILHDLGGPVGIGLASRRPELVKGLVMTQTFTWPPHVKRLQTMFGLMSSGPISGLNVGTNIVARLTSTKAGVGRNLDADARRAFRGPFAARGPRRRFHQLMGSVPREEAYLSDLLDAQTSLLAATPVLTIYGAKNDPFGFQRRLKEIFTHAVEMVVPDGNHFPMSDDPDGFAQAVISWHDAHVA